LLPRVGLCGISETKFPSSINCRPSLLTAFSKHLSSCSCGAPCFGTSLIRRWIAWWTCFAPCICRRAILPQECWLSSKFHPLVLVSVGKCCQELYICMACKVWCMLNLLLNSAQGFINLKSGL
jgi:hypothetical protein